MYKSAKSIRRSIFYFFPNLNARSYWESACWNRIIGRCMHMHAKNCIFNLRHRNGNDKNVVCLILKRHAVGNFKIWSYAVHRHKKYTVRKGEGRGVHPLSLPLINSLKKTELANFPCIYAFWGFPFFSA